MRSLLTVLLALGLSSVAAHAQLEMNDAGGSLTSEGREPVSGSPFRVYTFENLNATIEGNPLAGYILVEGSLAATPTLVPGGEIFHIDLAQPAILIVDGINGGGALWPFVGGQIDAFGQSTFSFPMAPVNAGQTHTLQAIVSDPTAMFSLNFTAPAQFQVEAATVLATFGVTEDEAIVVNLPTPFTFYGQSVTQMTVTTKGLIDFDGSGFIDWSPSTVEMDSGTASDDAGAGTSSPASPMIAAFWEDIEEVQGGVTVIGLTNGYEVSWDDARSFALGTDVGDFSARVDFGGPVVVTIDHTGLAQDADQIDPIVGITAGTVGAGTTINQVDLAAGGMVNVFVPTTPGNRQTIYQAFNVTAPVELVDTHGLMMIFTDGSGSGNAGEFLLF